MAEYGSMFLVSGLAAILFFGGANGPIPIFQLLGWQWDPNAVAFTWAWWTGVIANVAGVVNFIFKSVLFVTLMMWVRWTLPRLRIDQVMTTCWKYCVPIGCVCFIGATAWHLFALPSLNDLAPVRLPGEVREHWAAHEVATPPATTEAAKVASTRLGQGGDL